MSESESRPKVLILVAQRYNYKEFWPTLSILRKAQIDVDIVSTSKVIRSEETGEPHRISMTVADLNGAKGEDYAGLMVISGNPKDTEKYYTDKNAQRLIKEMNALGRPLAGICAAVPSLAPAVAGKKVSFFPLTRSREILSNAGAILTNVGITHDANLITAENEYLTRTWAEAFKELVLGRDPKLPKLHDTNVRPARIPRKPVPLIGQGKID